MIDSPSARPGARQVLLPQRLLDAIVSHRPEVATSIWLLQLRWVAVFGQLVTIAVAAYLCGSELPLRPLLFFVGFTAASNLVYGVWLRSEPAAASGSGEAGDLSPLAVPSIAGSGYSGGIQQRVAQGLMLVDLLTLTAMLHFSGGVDNPFSAFYFVNLAVSGILLQPPMAWGLTLLAVVGFGSLLVSYVPLSVLEAQADQHDNSLRHWGSFIAFATSASVVTYFIIIARQELVRRESELRKIQAEQARGRQLESLSTLAAGAAHELATPMSTALLVSRELQRSLEKIEVPVAVQKDLQLIESELRQCRAILDRMRAAAGDSAGERWQDLTLGELIDTVLEGIREPQRVEVTAAIEAIEDTKLWLPCEAVAQAVRNLIHNGLDASPADSQVVIDGKLDPPMLTLQIIDQGTGMKKEVLERVGQPFFTTKEPGRGMGLGLFLSQNVIQRLGGRLLFTPGHPRGTVARVNLPTNQRPPSGIINPS